MPKKVLVALPPGLLEQIDFVAEVEHRNRSDLIREALRRYLEAFKRTSQPNYVIRSANGIKLAELIDSRGTDSTEKNPGTDEDGSALEAEDGESPQALDLASHRKEMVLQS